MTANPQPVRRLRRVTPGPAAREAVKEMGAVFGRDNIGSVNLPNGFVVVGEKVLIDELEDRLTQKQKYL